MTQDAAVKEDTGGPTDRPVPPSSAAGLGAASRPLPALSEEQIAPAVEAILLTLDKPVSALRLAEALGLAPRPAPDDAPEASKRRPRTPRQTSEPAGASAIEAAIAALNQTYESTGRAFRIEAIAGGYRLMTLPPFAPV